MSNNGILKISPLGFPWDTRDPLIFCVHHVDAFPEGNGQFGPAVSLEGRNLGHDFTIKDGWRMYHGKAVPGFPCHPHRGFETVTVVKEGLVDHSDSMGAAGRYGRGDVQWLTAGKGIQHSEMFPLVHTEKENPMELFQIWLNLPKASKFVEPYFKMLWAEDIPTINETLANAKNVTIDVIAGSLKGTSALEPTPDSWAANPENNVAILTIKIERGATWHLPETQPGTNRTLYFYRGVRLEINGQAIPEYHSVQVNPENPLTLTAGDSDCFLLLLQGKPINEPVVQYGPFVMNTKSEIEEAFDDYRSTHFGGWPWPVYEQVHEPGRGRFAKHADGRIQEKD